MYVAQTMGIAYRNAAEVSIAVWAGVISDEDTEAHLERLGADPEWAGNGRILTDLTGLAEESRPSEERIEVTAELFRANIGRRASTVKWAMVADVTFEEATKFGERLAGDAPRLIVFTDVASACEWLGVDFTAVGPIVEDLRRAAE